MSPIQKAAVALAAVWLGLTPAVHAEKPVKVFILAGDENVLEQGQVEPSPKDGRGSDVPGTLVDVMAKEKRFSFLKDAEGKWVTRPDVVVYDAHRIHNETVAIGKQLTVGEMIGPDLMLGHVLGNALDEPALIIRYGTHSVFHSPGSRSLAHDYRPPSRGNASGGEGTWDVIHFNFGIWDTYRSKKGSGKKFDRDGELWVPLERYEKNLREIVGKLKETGATLIWGNITAVHEDCPSTRQEDVHRYNEAAARIMKENGVIINDFHAECLRQGFPKGTDVHSVGDLAPMALASIDEALKQRKTLSKPFPRVLIIGDSISSGYTHKVSAALDGKVTVYHNPGNAGSTDMGVKNIDGWLPLENYLLKGQEYMELVESVKAVFKETERFYPGYNGQKLELGGLIWFQGIVDSGSGAKAKEYEANLAGLIRDIRKDLDAPKLPVVIAANRHGTAQPGTNWRTVHDAQMALADPARYPEFANSLTCVDTTPFFRDKQHSPGIIVGSGSRVLYYPDRYNNHAESFLLIGEAMGHAMLKLLETTK